MSDDRSELPGRILVVGDVLVDVVVVPDGPLRHGTDTGAHITLSGGGSAANTAAWIAHQMTPVALVAALGTDPFADTIRTDLTNAGVDVLGPTLDGTRTGTCVVLVDATGERTMLPDRGANERLPASATVGALRGTESRVHVSGYTLLHDGSRAAGLAVLASARERGLPTSIDAASSGPLRDVGAASALELFRHADVVFANAEEVDALGGAEAVLRVTGALVTKHGADGATWTDARGTVAVPAAPARVIDTTGAGDALAAGTLARLRLGADPKEALRAGAALAAQAIARVGARP